MLVQRGQDFESSDRGSSPARTTEPLLDRGPRRKPSGLGAQQLRHTDSGLSSSSGQTGIHLVVEIADLHGFRHFPTVACVSHHKMQSCMRRSPRRERQPALGRPERCAVGLDPVAREALRARCEELLPPAPIEEAVIAWCARGRAP